ncbi:MAG: fumarylacetoacetate hydrolase family protein, partial [Anaerolineae bacterium]|nr:fumarylacetoacetate hydrolase family protein [Anaerolineae bacterium]
MEQRLHQYASLPTSPYRASQPCFLRERPWPRDMVAFLSLGDVGMSAARRLHDFLLRFLEQSDQALLAGAGFPLREVKLRAPIPRPRLYFGLVQNSPAFWRNDPSRPIVNLYPMGHQRPQGTVVGPGDPVVIARDAGRFGWNPELGVIIGRGGKDIDVGDAMRHIAGYTVVLDMSISDYQDRIAEQGISSLDWFEDATGSWLGKMSDTMCPMGPYLVTPDEVGNPYDLLVYTRQSGWLRDRAHTSAMVLGIERTISWLSSFLTLYPGDVVHMATMGVDGVPMTEDMSFSPEDYLEGKIERVGDLRVPVVMAGRRDWRPPDDPGRRVHPSPAVRDLIAEGEDVIEEPEAWTLEAVRHFWTVFGNYRGVSDVEGLAVRSLPRVLNCPARSLAISGEPLRIPRRARTLSMGVELAFVVGRLLHRASLEEALRAILGYLPMAVMRDHSFAEPVQSPATPQERNMPTVYARWADGFNVVSRTPVPLALEEVRGRVMHLAVEGVGEVYGNTDEYVLMGPAVLAFLSRHITLFPGDVVTLGRTRDLLTIPADRRLPEGIALYA